MSLLDIVFQILFLLAVLLLMLILYWSVNARVYKIVSTHGALIASPILAPGVILHEASHLIAATVLFRKIESVKFYSFDHSTGELGHVSYSHKKRTAFTFIFDTIIGLAPIAGGLLGIFSISYFLLDPDLFLFAAHEIHTIVVHTNPYEGSFWAGNVIFYDKFIGALDLSWNTAAWVVLFISISHGLLPSMADIKLSAGGVLILLSLLLALLIMSPTLTMPYALNTIFILEALLTALTFLIIPIIFCLIVIKILSFFIGKRFQ